ncbi:MAG: hypothetical protein KF752_16270 [Pirellulaceae bacterium]|nr:hypothetical protein [Pirellulaceae bacterium]
MLSHWLVFFLQCRLIGVATALMGMLIANTTLGQESFRPPKASDGELRWKFKPGQVIKMTIESKSTTMNKIGTTENGVVSKSLQQVTTKVLEVDSEEVAKVTVTIDRIRMQNEAGGQSATYDSADESTLTSQTALLAGVLKPLIGQTITQDFAPTGEISNIVVSENDPDRADKAGSPVVANSTQQVLVFPQVMPQVGGSWQKKSDMQIGSLKAAVTTDYKYLGVQDQASGPVHVVEGQLKTEFPQGFQGMQAKIIDQDSKVRIYFDGVNGRMVLSDTGQDMALEMNAGGRTFEVHLQQATKVGFEYPADTDR